MEWCDQTYDNLFLKDVFPDGLPCLSNLAVSEWEYVSGDRFKLILISSVEPKYLPKKWRDQGAERLHFNFDMVFSEALVKTEVVNYYEMNILSVMEKDGYFKVFDEGSGGVLISIKVSEIKVRVGAFCDEWLRS